MANLTSPVAYRQGRSYLWANVESRWISRVLMRRKNVLAVASIQFRKPIYGLGELFYIIYYPLVYIHNYYRKRSKYPRPYQKSRIIGFSDDQYSFFAFLIEYIIEKYELQYAFPGYYRPNFTNKNHNKEFLRNYLRKRLFRGSELWSFPRFCSETQYLIAKKTLQFFGGRKYIDSEFRARVNKFILNDHKFGKRAYVSIKNLRSIRAFKLESSNFKFHNLRDWKQFYIEVSSTKKFFVINHYQNLSAIKKCSSWIQHSAFIEHTEPARGRLTEYPSSYLGRIISNHIKRKTKVFADNVFKYLFDNKISQKGVIDQLNYWENKYKNKRFIYGSYFDIINVVYLLQHFVKIEHLLLDILKYTLFKMNRRNLKIKPFFYFINDVLKNTGWLRLLYPVSRIIITGKLGGGTSRTKTFKVGYGALLYNTVGIQLNFYFDVLRSKYGSYGIKILNSVSESYSKYRNSFNIVTAGFNDVSKNRFARGKKKINIDDVDKVEEEFSRTEKNNIVLVKI